MKFVEPIKDKSKLETMKSMLKHGYAKKQGSLRDWLLLTLGINSGLRISDLLSLTVEDVAEQCRLSITEQKTKKSKNMVWSPVCISAINEYLGVTGLTEGALFPSRKGGSSISRQQAWDIINAVARAAKVITKTNGVHIGTHSLRKTFAFHAYNSGVAVERLQKILNHSSSAVTLRYIGIEQEDLDAVYINSCL